MPLSQPDHPLWKFLDRLHDPDHPLWLFVKMVSIGGGSLLALFIMATEFDETEIKAWAPTFAGLVGWEVFQHRARKKRSETELSE